MNEDESYCPLSFIALKHYVGAYYNYDIIKMFHRMLRTCKFCPIFYIYIYSWLFTGKDDDGGGGDDDMCSIQFQVKTSKSQKLLQ
jgi:hypothetical protein